MINLRDDSRPAFVHDENLENRYQKMVAAKNLQQAAIMYLAARLAQEMENRPCAAPPPPAPPPSRKGIVFHLPHNLKRRKALKLSNELLDVLQEEDYHD